MTIKELIKMLQAYAPETEVVVYEPDKPGHRPHLVSFESKKSCHSLTVFDTLCQGSVTGVTIVTKI